MRGAELVGRTAHIPNAMRTHVLFSLNSPASVRVAARSSVCVCASSVYQKAPDDKLLRVQGEAGLRVWHQPAGSPAGEDGAALSVRLRCHHAQQKTQSRLRPQNGKRKTTQRASQIGTLSLTVVQPLGNCPSEQKIEVISVAGHCHWAHQRPSDLSDFID